MEADSSMTDRPKALQQYWQIQLRCDRIPKSQFQFNDQVAIYGEDDRGNRYCEIGLIVGMQYIAEGNQPAQWYYRIQYLKCDYAPCLAGTYDEYFKEESRFVADNTAI
jgi:hypothetical protein